MKKQGIIILFFVVLAVNSTGGETGNLLLQYVSKPLLMPLLSLFFVINTPAYSGPLKKWILLALFFSWTGDLLLLFQDRSPDFFLFGLAAFLLAHVFYIFFFHGVRVREGIKGKPLLLVPVAVYYAALMVWLSPYLHDMAMPVRIYGIIISFMLMLALHMLYLRNRETGKWMVLGALLFVLSDSILAVNKFYQSFSLAGVAIMVTYGLAQYLIIRGAILYLNGPKK